MNWYFYRVFLPLLFLALLASLGVGMGQIVISWKTILTAWFLIGPVGIGVGFHRLFSHRQFETARPLEIILALLGSFAAYAPLLFWVSNHRYHHQHSDQPEDPSSPRHHGFWESFLWYRLRASALEKVDIKNYCSRKILMDTKLLWISRNFFLLNAGLVLVLALFNLNWLVNAYLFPVLIEHLRINLVSSASHLSLPFSYRNFDTPDSSTNNLILGYLTFGFAWHNNHHQNERALSLHQRWWEIDLEGVVARILGRLGRRQLPRKTPNHD
jgi:fatty-acid desaturase